jgi:hypothetical protein
VAIIEGGKVPVEQRKNFKDREEFRGKTYGEEKERPRKAIRKSDGHNNMTGSKQ